jgi:hypothetical protein
LAASYKFYDYKILSILFSLPLEPFNEHTWWRLFQKHFVHIKSDIRWVFYFINEILQQLSIVFGNDQNSYIFPMISQKDIFSINRLTMKLKISGSVTDIQYVLTSPIKTIATFLNVLTYIIIISQLILSDLWNTSDNVCLAFQNWYYSIFVAQG